MTLVREFNLYLTAGRTIPLVINVNQFDSGEEWHFTLYNDDGTQYIPSTGAIVGIKSDGLGIINSGSVVDGKVVINETQQMTAAVGKAVFELMIDSQTHGTANFIVLVEEKPGNNADLSESDLSLLQEAIDATSPLPTGGTVGQVLTKTANGSTWSDAGTPTQEQVADAVSDWADEHITVSTGVVIDTSLSVAGAAADSKKVGDEITDLKSALESYEDIFTGDVDESVQNWLDTHPEATTTVQDGSIGRIKFTAELDDLLFKDTVFVTNANADSVLFTNAAKTNIRYILLEDLTINAVKTIANMEYCLIESYSKSAINMVSGGVVFDTCGYNKIKNVSFVGDVVVSGNPPFSYEWTAGTCASVVTLKNSVRNYFRGCSFDGGKINITLESSYVNTFDGCMIRDASNIGIYANYVDGYQPQINFNNCFINRNKNAGAYIKTGEIYFSGCVFQFNGNHAILDSGTAELFNIGVCDCDFENAASYPFVLRGTYQLSQFVVNNCTLSNDPSNEIEVFNTSNLTNPAQSVEFKNNYIYHLKICTDHTKFDSTCFIDATPFALAYQKFFKCRGLFKTSGINIPYYIVMGSRAFSFPLIGKYINGTLTLTFSEAVGEVSIITRTGKKVFTTSDNVTYTLTIDEPLEGVMFVDFLTTSHTSTLSSAVFAGTYER